MTQTYNNIPVDEIKNLFSNIYKRNENRNVCMNVSFPTKKSVIEFCKTIEVPFINKIKLNHWYKLPRDFELFGLIK